MSFSKLFTVNERCRICVTWQDVALPAWPFRAGTFSHHTCPWVKHSNKTNFNWSLGYFLRTFENKSLELANAKHNWIQIVEKKIIREFRKFLERSRSKENHHKKILHYRRFPILEGWTFIPNQYTVHHEKHRTQSRSWFFLPPQTPDSIVPNLIRLFYLSPFAWYTWYYYFGPYLIVIV